MKNFSVISGGFVYRSEPKFFAQKTDFFFFIFPHGTFCFHSDGNLELFRQKLELFPPYWDSKTIWTNHIYTSNVILG